jgi:hypothetical protein
MVKIQMVWAPVPGNELAFFLDGSCADLGSCEISVHLLCLATDFVCARIRIK